MKKALLLTTCLLFAFTSHTMGQGAEKVPTVGKSENQTASTFLYTFFFNWVPDQFGLPLIGLVNMAQENHTGAQIGLINWNQRNFKGAQVGLINTIRGDLKGPQIGLVNTTAGQIKGVQVGLVNTAVSQMKGPQIGLVNLSAEKTKSLQLGLINISKKREGVQIGLINYTDSLSGGVPIGLLNLSKNGSYHALEVGINETFPLNASYKIGLRKYYTSVVVSYNPAYATQLAYGVGFGTIIPIGPFFLNPEVLAQNTSGRVNHKFTSLTVHFGSSLNARMEIVVGPSFVWKYAQARRFDKAAIDSALALFGGDLNESHRLMAGFRAGLRYSFIKQRHGK